MNLNVFNIQRFSIYDGPGIRTTVFLKGCSMRCCWCHNPESIFSGKQVQFMVSKCIGCNHCKLICPRLTDGKLPILANYLKIPDECLKCEKCANTCPSKSLEIIGKDYEVDELLQLILRDKEFYYESSGGVTFSGGEPLLQSAALRPLMQELANKNIHCAVETAGDVPWQALENITELTDLFIYDIKILDNDVHIKGTGKGNAQILDNFRKLYETDADIIVRIPVIPGFNDTVENMTATAEFLSCFPKIKCVELMPFHNMAQHKYESLCMPYLCEKVEEPSYESMQHLNELFKHETGA